MSEFTKVSDEEYVVHEWLVEIDPPFLRQEQERLQSIVAPWEQYAVELYFSYTTAGGGGPVPNGNIVQAIQDLERYEQQFFDLSQEISTPYANTSLEEELEENRLKFIQDGVLIDGVRFQVPSSLSDQFESYWQNIIDSHSFRVTLLR